jgi:hypothetical protein
MTYLEEVNGRSITVRNVEYTIEVLSEEEIDDITGEKVFGLASDERSKIYLRAGMNDDRAEQVLTHELLHTMFFESGYTFKDEDQEEEVVEALSLVMQDMINAGFLDITLDDHDEEIEIRSSPTFMGEPLFKAPQLFCNNEEFDPNKHYKGMFLVKTLWDTYTVNTYGKNRLDLAIQKNVTNVEVYDFQTKKHQYIALSHITEVIPLENKKEEPKECIEYYFVSTKHRDYKVSQCAYENIIKYMDKPNIDTVNIFDYITEEYANIRPKEVTEVHKLVPLTFKEEK